jgi:hypothetical protein
VGHIANLQAALDKLASHYEDDWHLAKKKGAWIKDKSQELRNMMRHIDQALRRTLLSNQPHPTSMLQCSGQGFREKRKISRAMYFQNVCGGGTGGCKRICLDAMIGDQRRALHLRSHRKEEAARVGPELPDR